MKRKAMTESNKENRTLYRLTRTGAQLIQMSDPATLVVHEPEQVGHINGQTVT